MVIASVFYELDCSAIDSWYDCKHAITGIGIVQSLRVQVCGSTSRLSCWPPSGQQVLHLRNPLHAGDKACMWGDRPWLLNPGQTSLGVQTRGFNGPTKLRKFTDLRCSLAFENAFVPIVTLMTAFVYCKEVLTYCRNLISMFASNRLYVELRRFTLLRCGLRVYCWVLQLPSPPAAGPAGKGGAVYSKHNYRDNHRVNATRTVKRQLLFFFVNLIQPKIKKRIFWLNRVISRNGQYIDVYRRITEISQRTRMFTARKRSLGQGNIFRSVCQEFCPWGGAWSGGWAVPAPRGVVPGPGVPAPGGVPDPDPAPGGLGGLVWGGCLVETPRWLLLRAVRTLLECILVKANSCLKVHKAQLKS